MRTRGLERASAEIARLDALEPRSLLTAISWDGGGGDALWSNPLNWSLNFVPRQVDDVTISVPGVQRTIIADTTPIRVNSLTLDETLIVNSGVNLTSLGPFDVGAPADLRINGLVNWASGTWASDDPVNVNPGGSLNIGSTAFPTLGGVTVATELDNAGRLAWRGGTVAVDGSIINRAGKAMDFASPLEMTGAGSLTNHGLLRKGGQSDWTTTIDVAFETTDRFFILRGGVAIGTDAASAPARIEGSMGVLDLSAEFTFNAEATHADGVEYRGSGKVTFTESDQTFEGDALFAAQTVLFEGEGQVQSHVFVTGPSVMRGGFDTDLAVFHILANLTLDGTFDLSSSILSDTGGAGILLTIDGTVVASGVALVIDTRVLPGSVLQAGLDDGTQGSLTISGVHTLTNRGTLRHHAGTLGISSAGTLRNEAGATLILMGPTVGGVASSGPVVNLGTLIRQNSDTNNATTVITGKLDNKATVDVREGTLSMTGLITQLPAVPAAQDTTLTGGTWRVRHGATLDVPRPIEIIGTQATLELIGLSGVPDLVGNLRENRGLMLLSGNRPGISGPGPAIVNKGTIQMDGDTFSLQVFETPVDQRAAGRIIVKNGTLQMHGISGATRNFANPGLIRVEAGNLTLNLDEGGVLGTFTNTGTLDLRQNGQLIVDGAMSTSGTVLAEIGNPFRGHVTSTRNIALGGTLRATFVGQNYYNFFSASIFVPGSLTVSGSFSTFTPVNTPSGFTPVLITQFGVQVRLEE